MSNKYTKDIYRDSRTGRITKQVDHHCSDDLSNVLIAGASLFIGYVASEAVKYFMQSKKKSKAGTTSVVLKTRQNTKSSYSAKRAHLTRKTNIVVEGFKVLLRKRSPKEIIKQLNIITNDLENLELYAEKLNSDSVRISINDKVWNQFMDIKYQVADSCKNLKGKLIENGIHNFPKFQQPKLSKKRHRTLNEIYLVKNQFEHSIELATYLQSASHPSNSQRIENKNLLTK